jgi:hypothetical protein
MHDSNEPKEARVQPSLEQSQAAQDYDSSSSQPNRRATQLPRIPSLTTLAVAFYAAPPDLIEILNDVIGGKH